MKKANASKIKQLAEEFAKAGKKWHFHIMTPECQLNEKGNYALVLENTSDDKVYVCYSSKPYMDVGKELVKLLHGDDVIKKDDNGKKALPSPQVNKLLKRAKELNKEGQFWHHHMLFPDCKFNNNKGSWTIIFEDQENKKVIESITRNEPKSDLQHIEKLFYQQKR